MARAEYGPETLETSPASAETAEFYGEYYRDPSPRFKAWRERAAELKVDHIVALCRDAGVKPTRTLEVGCGDGALLAVLAERGFGGDLGGIEVAEEPVALLRGRSLPRLALAERFDGRMIPLADNSWDLGILSHVLEHVSRPVELLQETARVCQHVVVEVPIEDNVFAARRRHNEKMSEIGHLQQLSLASARSVADWAGIEILADREIGLPLWAYTHFTEGVRGKLLGYANGLARTALYRVIPNVAPHLFTVHYAFLGQAARTGQP